MKHGGADAVIEVVTWAEPDYGARRLLALALARMSFLRPIERCTLLARCRLTEFADLSVDRLARLVQRRVGARHRPLPPAAWLERAAGDVERLTIGRWRCTFVWEPGYPRILREIYDPPVVLFYRGERPPSACAPLVAVVGTRRPTGEGRRTAFAFGFELARCGVATGSGLARGIDLEVHRGSVAGWQGEGCGTVAVLGCGVDRIYPGSSRPVAHRVLRSGCFVSEFPPGTAPYAHHFPQRNRIVAGLSRAVLVVEAPAKSGALITARCAAEQGREVLVAATGLSGSRAAGCAALAEDGVVPVTGTAALLREVGLRYSGHETQPLRTVPPPAGQRATGAWLARMFAAEQQQRVAVSHGRITATEGCE